MTRKNIKVKLNRKHLIRLLKRWQRGEVVEREVHETAKALWDNIGEFLEPIKNRSVYVREWPEYSKDDDRSIIIEIINKLAWLDDECLTKKDIPYMLEFLSTPQEKLKKVGKNGESIIG